VSWEAHAAAAVNARSPEALREALEAAVAASGGPSASARVLVARDTRPSGQALAAAVAAGAAACGASVSDLGLLTTPALHLAVLHASQGLPFCNAFDAHVARLAGGLQALLAPAPAPGSDPGPLWLDCADGVGGPAAAALAAHPALRSAGVRLQLVNAGQRDLNARRGADYVQKARAAPEGLPAAAEGGRGCSLDGDADRAVWWQAGPPGVITRLLDGDRQACLLALQAAEALQALVDARALQTDLLSLAVIQTAYANGGAADYVRHALGRYAVRLVVTRTGVKHLHAAAERFDIACYWESNGHGSVLFSGRARAALAAAEAAAEAAGRPAAAAAARQLLGMEALSNPAVGDGLANILLVEAVLRLRGLDLGAWQAMYAERPSRHLALRVADRAAVRTAAEDERVCTAPHGLQAAIDSLVAAAGAGARAFVRASGTEDVVRVYSEACSAEGAEALAAAVGREVHARAGGIGAPPQG